MSARKPPYDPPSPEIIAEAKRLMREDQRGLDELAADFSAHFAGRTPLHHFTILPQIDVAFRAYVFLDRDADIAPCQADGVAEQMWTFVRDRLRTLEHDAESVAFEFDSFENVQRNFSGNYFLRMRA